jgi:hypothetical protein
LLDVGSPHQSLEFVSLKAILVSVIYMIKTLVFDLGGVLFSEGKSVVLDELASVHGHDRKLVGALLSSPQSISLRKGLISDERFWGWAQLQLPSDYDCELIQRAWYNSYILDPDAYALIANLRKKHSIIAFREISRAASNFSRRDTTSASCSISNSTRMSFT